MRYLFMSSIFIHLFICCLFFLFSFSLSYHMCFPFLSCFLCLWPLLKTSIWNFCTFWLFCVLVGHFDKFLRFCMFVLSLCLFVIKKFLFCFYSPVFLNMILFCSLSWTSVSPFFLHFYCPFWIFFFWEKIPFDLIILFLPFFYFLTLNTPILSTKNMNFLNSFRFYCLFFCFFFQKKCFPCVSLFHFFKGRNISLCFLFLLVFLFFRNKRFFSENLCFLSFNFLFLSLHFFHQKNLFNIFPFRMSSLPLYFLLLFLLYRLVVLFCLSAFPHFFHLFFALFEFRFPWSFIVALFSLSITFFAEFTFVSL